MTRHPNGPPELPAVCNCRPRNPGDCICDAQGQTSDEQLARAMESCGERGEALIASMLEIVRLR